MRDETEYKVFQINVRLTRKQIVHLENLAAAYGQNVSAMLRWIIENTDENTLTLAKLARIKKQKGSRS